MRINIDENIRNMRKQQNMTQEQLAETLGVSIAAVSKWERGIAMPDLSYIIEMADLFGISVDVLVGYQVQSGAAEELEKRIHEFQQKKDFEAASMEAEKALLRYPNDFYIVHRCGEMYHVMGMENGDKQALEKAIELFNRAIPLLSQNTDSNISEVTIRMEMAESLLELGREAEGIEMLKKTNIRGMNAPMIGYTYATSSGFKPEDAAPYLFQAYARCMQMLIETMSGFANMFSREKKYDSALDATLWLIHYLESLKCDVEEVSYVDKLLAMFYAECGYLTGKGGLTESAKAYLDKACKIAVRFDREPTYGVKSLKFCIGETKNATAFDNTGSTAIMAVENMFRKGNSTPEIIQYWEEIKNAATGQ